MTQVSALWRHPIKGHGREALTGVTLAEGQAMPWDRLWAVAHELARLTEGEWAPCTNFSIGAKAPALMAINARVDETAGLVTLSHPDRPDLTFDPDRDAQAFLDWVRPLMPVNRAQSVRLFRLDGRGVTDTDYPSVSLLNLASNADLAARMEAEVSPLRWRCNIHLDGLAPWAEFDLVGRYEFDCSLGIEEASDGRLLSASGSCSRDAGCSGSIRAAAPDSQRGLVYVDASK